MKMKKVKTAVIGCGMISNIYLRNLKKLFYIIDLVAVCDNNEKAARKQAEAFQIAHVMTSAEIAASSEIELVVCLTGPSAHYSVIKEMLLAGKHVYTEKMFTTNLKEAEELVELAERKNLYLGVAPDTVLGAGIQTARRMIMLGLIGEVTSIQINVNRNQSLNSEKFRFLRRDGGALPYDVGIYYIAVALTLCGPVSGIRAFGKKAPEHQAQLLYEEEPEAVWQIPGNNLVSAALEFESGAIGSVLFDGNTTSSVQHGFTVFGTKGILKIGDPNRFDGETRLILPNSEEMVVPFTHGYDGTNLIGEKQWYDAYGDRGIGVAEMAWALRMKRKNNRCSKEYGLHCMEVLLGIDEAAATGETYQPHSRFHMDPLECGYYSKDGIGRGDAERSLMY